MAGLVPWADLGIRHRAVAVAAGGVVAADRHQAGVFALGAGVGLHADGVEAGDRAQLGGEAFDHLEVAGGLVGGAKGGCRRTQAR